jgi:STE24 endopeptidase
MFLGFAAILSSIVALPWSWYSHFKLEEKFGFNRMTPKVFWTDQMKGLILTFILGGLILFPFLWLMKAYGIMWVVPALGIWIGLQILIMGLGMRVIAPLFNKFTPLENEELKGKITHLVQEAGLQAQGVFVMDASKRSGHGNAYFTGIGRYKRIVFYDTLMDKITAGQILAVLAHEIGHLRHGHIWKGFLFSVLFSSLAFLALAWLQTRMDIFLAFNLVPTPGPLFLMAGWLAPLVTFPLTPIFSWRSRAHEFQADQYAVSKTSAKDLGDALLALHRDNAASVVHDELYSAVFFSHPPLAQRLAKMGH